MSMDHRSLMHATAQIIQMIESSKASMDEMLDDLPAGFSLVDPEGKVFRANRMLAEIFGCDLQDCLNQSFYSIFDESGKERMASVVRDVSRTGRSQKLELLVKSKGSDSDARVVQWSVAPIAERGGKRMSLLAVLGSDVSELRNTQSRIADLFNTLPIGIMSIRSNGLVGDVYTGSCGYLLGEKELVGKPIVSLLFPQGLSRLSNAQQKAVLGLTELEGMNPIAFDALRESIPAEVRIESAAESSFGHRYLGVSFQPIVESDQVTKVLLLLQDRTALVEARERDLAEREAETRSIKRILQVKRVAVDVLPVFVEEISALMERTQELLAARKARDLGSVLHGVKGNSRVARFEALGKMAHELEERVLAQAPSNLKEEDWSKIASSLAEMKDEWSELCSLAQALLGTTAVSASPGTDSKTDVIRSLRQLLDGYQTQRVGYVGSAIDVAIDRIRLAMVGVSLIDAASLESWLRTAAQETANEVGKDIDFEINWGGVLLDEATRKHVTEVLLHLVNNAIDHGVETPEVRKQAGKNEKGVIQIFLSEENGKIHGIVKDDGGGIDSRAVKLKAIRMGLISGDSSRALSQEEALSLIFESGLSTREKVTAVSGRGVGLAAVKEALKDINGSIVVKSEPGKGSQFDFWIEYTAPVQQQRRLVTFGEFASELEESLQFMSRKQGCPFDLSEIRVSSELKQRLLYCSPRHLVIALTQRVLDFSKGRSVKLALTEWAEGGASPGHVCLEIRNGVGLSPDRQRMEPTSEFSVAPHISNRILGYHGAHQEQREEGLMQVTFKELFAKKDLPTLGFRGEESLSDQEQAQVAKWGAETASSAGLTLVPFDQAVMKITVSRSVEADAFDAIPVQSDFSGFQTQVLRALNRNLGFDN